MTTFEALSHKTRTAATIEELNNVEARHEKHYNNGTITQAELIRLDRIAMNQYIQIVEVTQTPSQNP